VIERELPRGFNQERERVLAFVGRERRVPFAEPLLEHAAGEPFYVGNVVERER
jgi:hypothetical protein